MIEFDDTTIRMRLRALSSLRQLAFAVLLVERMMPALQEFSADTGFEALRYRACLDLGWEYLSGKRESEGYQSLSRSCFEGAPDTEDFDHPLVSAALNAALSASALMSFLLDKNIDHILEISELARDTAAINFQLVEAAQPRSLLVEDVMESELVKEELQSQAADLTFAESLAENDLCLVVQMVRKQLAAT